MPGGVPGALRGVAGVGGSTGYFGAGKFWPLSRSSFARSISSSRFGRGKGSREYSSKCLS